MNRKVKIMKTLILYVSLLIFFFTLACNDDDKLETIANGPPAKTYTIIEYDPVFKTIVAGDGRLYEGGWAEGRLPIAHIDNDKIREGALKKGTIIAEIKGNQVFGKNKAGKDFIATIDGFNIINGPAKYGYPIESIDHATDDLSDITVGALMAVYFLYFSGKEYPDKNYTHILNPETQSIYAIVENGKLFFTKNSNTAEIYMQGDTAYSGKEIIVIQNGNRVLEPLFKSTIALIENNRVIRYDSENKDALALIDGNDPAAGALAVAAQIKRKDLLKTSEITDNYSSVTRATVYFSSFLFEGKSINEKPLVLLEGDKIIRGDSEDRGVIAVIKGNQLIRGNSKDGKAIAEIKKDEIILNTASGRQTVIGKTKFSENIKDGALGAAYMLLISMPDDPTWVKDKNNSYTSAIIYKDKLYKGGYISAEPLLYLDGNNIMEGSSENGKIIATINGNQLIRNGSAIAEISDNQIIRIPSSGNNTVIGYFYGNESMRMGALGAAYLTLENNSSGGNSSGGSSPGDTPGTSNPTYIRKGSSGYGTKVATFYNNELKEGSSIYGKTVAVLNGNSIKAGNSSYGTTIAVVHGNKIVKGSSYVGTVIANINGNKIIEGSSAYGNTIGIIDGDGGINAGALGAVYLLLLK